MDSSLSREVGKEQFVCSEGFSLLAQLSRGAFREHLKLFPCGLQRSSLCGCVFGQGRLDWNSWADDRDAVPSRASGAVLAGVVHGQTSMLMKTAVHARETGIECGTTRVEGCGWIVKG
jgi:hypothetical protein